MECGRNGCLESNLFLWDCSNWHQFAIVDIQQLGILSIINCSDERLKFHTLGMIQFLPQTMKWFLEKKEVFVCFVYICSACLQSNTDALWVGRLFVEYSWGCIRSGFKWPNMVGGYRVSMGCNTFWAKRSDGLCNSCQTKVCVLSPTPVSLTWITEVLNLHRHLL